MSISKIVFLLVIALGACSAHAKGKQNVVYFLVDNLGMGELSVYSGGPLRGTMTRSHADWSDQSQFGRDPAGFIGSRLLQGT